MKSVKILLFILAIMGVSGFELEQEKDFFHQKHAHLKNAKTGKMKAES